MAALGLPEGTVRAVLALGALAALLVLALYTEYEAAQGAIVGLAPIALKYYFDAKKEEGK